jgi:hypothetical protein
VQRAEEDRGQRKYRESSLFLPTTSEIDVAQHCLIKAEDNFKYIGLRFSRECEYRRWSSGSLRRAELQLYFNVPEE